jgi:hypothetical protein
MKSSIYLAAAILVAATPALAGEAEDFVRTFYTDIQYEADPTYRDKFVDPARAKLEENDKTPDGDVGCIDGILALNAQDYDDTAVKKSLKLEEKLTGDDATVAARFSLLDDDQPESVREIVWSLKKVGGAWKVADIAAPADNWKLSALDCGSGQ